MNEDYRKHVRGTLFTALYALPLNLKGIILIPVLTKSLDVSVYGAFVVAQTIISLLSGVSALGLQASLSQFFPTKKGTVEGARLFYSVFWMSLATNALVFLLVMGFADTVGRELSISSTEAVEVGAIVALSSIFGVAVEYFRASERFGLFLIIVGARAYLEIAVIAFVALSIGSLAAIFESMLIVVLLFAVGTSFWVLSKIGRPHPPNLLLGACLKFSLPLIPSTLSDWVINSSDRFLIGLILGGFAVGIYNPAYALGSIILIVPTIFVTMLPPLLARVHDNGKMDTFDEIIRYTLKYFLLIAIPVLFGSLVLSRPLLSLLSSKEIAEKSYFITPVVIFGAIFYGCARVLLHVLQVKLQTRSIAKAWFIAAVVNLVFNIIFLRVLGIVAAAISTAIAFGVAYAIIKKHTDNIHPVRLSNIPVVRIILSSLAMGGVVGVSYLALSQEIFLNLAVGVISYCLFLLAFRVFEQREKRLMGSLLGKALQFAR